MKKMYEQELSKTGSALLLTVMIIAILTTTTLASIAVRFDQLASTDKVANATVAKSAADSALVKLKEKLVAGTPPTTTGAVFDLDKNEETTPISTPFRPSPRKIVSTYQKISTSLPRCNGVIVLLPWTNDGQYLQNQTNDANPAMIFNYANIVNDTPLGIIPGNGALGGAGVTTEKNQTISQLTNMGHFYNPFAPIGAKQKDLNYWTVKLGGPQDQFLTKKDTDGASSFYKNVDFVYLPYLPRWSDSGLFTSAPGTKVDRISASALQTKFETIIKENNFKVWIDASISDAQLYQYGFGDLFVNSTDYKLKWLQPSLWNDTPEADDLSTPYKTDDAENATLTWNKKSQPVMTLGANDSGWNTAIIKGAKSFSFIKLTTNPTFSPNATISGSIYGSLEGLRLDQAITLILLDKNQQPLSLQSRGQDQGRLYNVKLTNIGPTSISNGIESISVTFKLGNDAYSTPSKPGGTAVTGSDIDTIAVAALPQFSTTKSTKSVTINTDADGLDATIAISSNCSISAQLTACPAVGDLVSLTKSGSTPVWGKVTKANFNGSGTTLDNIVLDKLHKSPLPTREMAYTYFTSGGSPRIAYYGGAVNMNDYDGGYSSESDQLWIYDPEADTWTFKAPGATNPGRRAGASMVYDNTGGNNRLVMIGGYYHEAINSSGDCETAQTTCLYTNRPGLRIAKRVTNDVYAFSLTNNTWEKIDYTSTFGAAQKIQNGQQYTVRVTSTLADRSGLERWNMTTKTASTNQNQTLNVNNTATDVVLYPSAAGVARGDDIYLYGNKLSDSSNFYAWAKINSVNYSANSVNLTVYGYQPAGGETSVVMKSLALQVVKRQITTNTCVGGAGYFCQFSSNDSTGYAVGDSVVLEQYAADNSQLNNTLAGYISHLDATGKAYFVADERIAGIKDFSEASTAIAASDSAVAFPSPRYGATFSLQPLAPTKASYWEGAAKNINYQMRFADLWNVQFVAGSGAASAVWSPQPTTNDTASLSGSSYRFQVIKPNYTYQIPTTTSTINNPQVIKVTQTDPKTGASITAWDNNQRWQLEVASTEASKVVTGAWATLERRLSDGTRETFHGIVEKTFSSPPSGCTAYDPAKLCLRHNSSFPNDSGFAGNSAGVKVTMSPSFSTSDSVGGTFGVDLAGGKVTLTNVPNGNFGRVPGLGAMVMIWRDSSFPSDAYTFIVKDRTFTGTTFNFFYDKIIASPHPFGFSSSQIASAGGTDRLVTITDHQMDYYDSTNAPEWVKDVTTGAWKIRLAAKNPNLLYRPSPRRAGTIASIYTNGLIILGVPTPGTSQIFMTGGTFGQYGSLWKQNNAGATTTNTPAWTPQYVSATSTYDIPNLYGGSLVAYKVSVGGTPKIRLISFGGKQKTDISSADYGLSIGAKMLGRPDNGAYIDNSFYITDNFAANDATAVSMTKTIEDNASGWPTGVDKSLKFQGSNRNNLVTCAYLGQAGCTSKQLMSQLGNMGRLDDSSTNDTYNGWSWGRTAILSDLGARFKSQGSTPIASLIMSVPTLSGAGVNGRWDQDGYRPYCKDNASGGCLNLAGASAYGKLATDFGSDKTAGLIAYTAINNATDKGGAILATSVGVGNAIASSRGGGNGTTKGWHSYCAASEIKKTGGVVDLNLDGTYICQSSASRYLPTLPDAEDLLFLLNAAQALGATDTYKVVGYYGGVKRGYLVTSVSGTLPKVYEIVP